MLVSGVATKVQQFHNQLKDCSWLHGEPGQKKLILQPGESGLVGVVNNESIPFHLYIRLGSVLNFLASQFDAGLEYRTLNIYRSALSATHPQIEGFKVGEHPLVVQLLKGIFNSRPPAPRYTSTWDVSKVTSYLEGLGPSEQLSLRQLSKKLASLRAITSAERGSELIAHDLRFRRVHPEGVSFNLPELTKGVRVGKPLKTSFHSSFPENVLLCPCSCLKEYELRTQAFRPDAISEPNKLFLSVINPHKPVSSATLSHWVKDCLLEAGIDSQVFKSHATRGAATSAAVRAGVSIPEIIRLADWTNETTFKRFFYRPVWNASFGRSVLDSAAVGQEFWCFKRTLLYRDEYYDVQLKIMQRLLAACSMIIIVQIVGGEI